MKCGAEDNLEAAHKVGRWAKGADTEDNVVTLCAICHFFQPDDGNQEELEAYLSDPLTHPQRLAVEATRTALKLVEKGRTAGQILATLETVYKLYNELGDINETVGLLEVIQEMQAHDRSLSDRNLQIPVPTEERDDDKARKARRAA